MDFVDKINAGKANNSSLQACKAMLAGGDSMQEDLSAANMQELYALWSWAANMCKYYTVVSTVGPLNEAVQAA